MKTLFLAENGVKIKNLTGYTAYMVSVAAFNAAGDGPRSTPTRGQTQQAGGEGRRGRGGPPGLWALGGMEAAERSGLGTQAPWDALHGGRAQPPKRGLGEPPDLSLRPPASLESSPC